MWDIGDQLGFDRDLTISIAQYLKGEGLLEFRALGGIISITHYGNKEVEENLKKYVQISEQILSTDPKCRPRPCMAGAEHPEKYNWWLNELESLGISTLQKNGLSNHKEASDLTEPVKQSLYENYLQV